MSVSKRVILIGPTGSGKSWLGNKLLTQKVFTARASTHSITDGIVQRQNEIILKDNKKLNLTVVDTPGIGDTEGRSKQFMDEIITFIKTNRVNMLFIVVPYKRIDSKGLRNQLLALRECINGYYFRSTVLIVNQVPTDYQLQENNPPQTLKQVEDEAKKEFAEILNTSSSITYIFIRVQTEQNENFKKHIEHMYDAIANSTDVPSSIVRTWTDTLQFYQGIINGKVSAKESLDDEIKRKRDQLARLENDKASSYNRAALGLCAQYASIGLVFVPVVGPLLGIGVNVACGAAVVYNTRRIEDSAHKIRYLDVEIDSLSAEIPNAEREVKKAKQKLAEIHDYL